MSLKLKVVAKCGDPKLLADAMKSYPGIKNINTRDCALESSVVWIHQIRKHVMTCTPGADYDSHQPKKVNYFISRLNTHRSKRACIEESLNFGDHGVAHATCVLETDCLVSQWHIARLPPSLAKKCWTMQPNIGSLCNAKINIRRHDILAPTSKGLKEFLSTNNVEHKFWFCPDDIKRCVSGNK